MDQYCSNVFYDLSTSVNVDVAIGILIGLRTVDPIRHSSDPEDDPDAAKQKYLDGLDISIFDHIGDMRIDAQNDVDDAIEEKNHQKRAEGKDRIRRCDELTRLAHRYLSDINAELAKGDGSMLIVDLAATGASNNRHIEISSLNKWAAHQGYPKPVLGEFQSQQSQVNLEKEDTDAEEMPDADGGMSPTAARSFLVTFAILLEQFVERSGNQFKSEGGNEINKKTVAELINKHSNTGARKGNFRRGQSVSSIEARINAALVAVQKVDPRK